MSTAIAAADALPHPLLVADIGGTNCRMSLVGRPGAAPEPLLKLATAEHAEAALALAEGIAAAGVQRPRALALAVAGPVERFAADLTNADWRLDAAALTAGLDVEACLLLNDFEALAGALAQPGGLATEPVGPALPPGPGTRLVMGPGTGFGAAALVGKGERLAIAPTEAGHMQIGPVTEAEWALWPALRARRRRLSVEALLSGAGLARLHAAVRGVDGEELEAEEVHHRACDGEPDALAAVSAFTLLAARVAGDLALAHKATGGVWIAGGVMPRLLPFLDHAQARTLFEDKPPMDGLMRAVPLAVVTAPDMAETGLAAIAAAPHRFGAADRVWWRNGR